METKIGNQKDMLKLTSSGFWLVPKSMKSAKFYSVNNVTISTHRNLVEHTMPGRKGSVFQDMGRPAIKIVIEGNLNESGILAGLYESESSRPMLAKLHKLCDEGMPLEFICDMPALFGVSQVIIEDLEATEAKGRKNDYDYRLTLKEWSEILGKDMMGELLEGRKKAAKKKLLKKMLIVGAAAAAVPVYKAVKSASEELSLVVSLRFNPQRMKAGQSSQVTVVVSDSKGGRIEGATVKVTSKKGADAAEQNVAAGLATNADGMATATFKGEAAGEYTITATASKSGYAQGSRNDKVIVDPASPTP